MKKEPTLTTSIKKSLASRGRGSFVFIDDFSFASSDKVKVTLKRLADKEYLIRIDRGIYYFPKLRGDKIINPTDIEIVKAITRHEGAKYRDNNQVVLNGIGLSEQVPMKLVILTDGLNKKIHWRRLPIAFTPDPFRNSFKLKGNQSKLAIFALLGLGEDNITPDAIEKLKPRILLDSPKILNYNLKLSPEWIQKVFYDNGLVR